MKQSTCATQPENTHYVSLLVIGREVFSTTTTFVPMLRRFSSLVHGLGIDFAEPDIEAWSDFIRSTRFSFTKTGQRSFQGKLTLVRNFTEGLSQPRRVVMVQSLSSGKSKTIHFGLSLEVISTALNLGYRIQRLDVSQSHDSSSQADEAVDFRDSILVNQRLIDYWSRDGALRVLSRLINGHG